MKYVYLLLAAGCLAFTPAQADTAYPHSQAKRQAQGRYLSDFWKDAQVSQAVVDVFYDSGKTLDVDKSDASVGFPNVKAMPLKSTLVIKPS